MDATDFGGSKVDLVEFCAHDEGTDGSLVGKVKFSVGAGEDGGLALGFQDVDDGVADHAVMAGDVDFKLVAHFKLRP